MPSPMTPAPTTIVFGRVVEPPKVALMTDSLHRACPARFCGSDLSRRARGQPRRRATPQPAANFKPSPAAMQGFSAALPRRDNNRDLVNVLVRVVGHSSDTPASLPRRPQGHPPSTL